MKRQLILSSLASHFWALEPKYLETMSSVLHRWSAGVDASADVMADVEAAQAARASRKAAVANLGGGIAVLGLYGLISQRASMVDGMSGSGGTSVEKFTQSFREAMADDTVGGIIIDIDSPGGSVSGLQDLWDEIMSARSTKPVYGLVNSLCASAAYWIGSACSQLYAVQGSLVGSIGVYMQHVDASESMKMDGLNATYISAGKYKVEGNPLGPMSAEGLAFNQSQIDAYYSMFTGAVAKGRGAAIGQVRDGMGQGRCLMASEGLSAGMVDGIDTFDGVVKRMSKTMKATGASAAASIPTVLASTVAGETAPSSGIAGANVAEISAASTAAQPKARFAVGDRVKAMVNHMDGMKGMEGEIALAENGPYYAIKFDKPVEGMAEPHKWLADDELEAADNEQSGDDKGAMNDMASATARRISARTRELAIAAL